MNTPRFNPQINPDDPKWTAYVLGELDDADRAEIEQLLETSSQARALVEELQLAATTLKEELTPAGALGMNAEQRNAVLAAAKPAPRHWAPSLQTGWGVGLAAAATLLFAVTGAYVLTNRSSAPPTGSVALNMPVDTAAPVERLSKLSTSSVTQPDAGVPAGSANPKASLELTESRLPVGQQTSPSGVAVEPVISMAEFAARAQGGSPVGTAGAINGKVLDSSGAMIPGVNISALNQATGSVVNTVTNESGAYDLSNLPPGNYRASAALPGFQTSVVTGLQVGPAETKRVDFPLQVARIATAVEVTVDRAASSVGQVMPTAPAGNAGAVAGGGRGGGVGQQGQQPQQGQQAQRQQSAAILRQGLDAGTGVGPGAGVAGGVLGGVMLPLAGTVAASPPPPLPPAAPLRADNFPRVSPNTEAYDRIVDNPFIRATQENLATFSIDVDTASYANVRRFLTQNQLPPRDAVRIEEMINYFSYDYARPNGNAPIAPNMEVAAAPWNPSNRLVRIGIKAREIDANRRPPSNLVFLIDVSGSMNTPVKLPLVKQGLKLLVDRLGENDTVSIVVYAGASGLVLRPTNGMRKEVINQAIDSLYPGGSTNGASGIRLAYDQAVVNFIRGGANRVVLMTDGDFNVGVTNQGELTRLIEERAKSGVFLSVLGFGMGNIKDSTLERLADQGNGHYAYIDTINEARKVLVEEMGGTLVTVAKDVKIQVDFNPGQVEAYRLIGYENRVLRTEDFNNDLKDAGDMGAGHTVTALFEVVPKGGAVPGPSIDPSKYIQPATAGDAARPANTNSNEMLTLRVRYKLPDESTSSRLDVPLVDRGGNFTRASSDFRFAASVAGFGMILRDSPYRGSASIESVLDIAEGSRGSDRNGYRQEFISLVQKARSLR